MNDLRCVTLHFYFKIKDADMFGGKGTIGCSAISSEECLGSDKFPFDKMVSINGFSGICDSYREILSFKMEVPIENVIPISRDEYKENIEEDEEFDIDRPKNIKEVVKGLKCKFKKVFAK